MPITYHNSSVFAAVPAPCEGPNGGEAEVSMREGTPMAFDLETQLPGMFKKIISSTLTPGESLQFLDVGAEMDATELSRVSEAAIDDTYKKGLLGQATSMPGLIGAGARLRAGKKFNKKNDEIARYGVLVTDKAIHIIPVTMKTKGMSVEYVPVAGQAPVALPREQVALELGNTDETTFYGQKSTTIEVSFIAQGSPPIALKMGNVDRWRQFAAS